jgi:hypothetical protein
MNPSPLVRRGRGFSWNACLLLGAMLANFLPAAQVSEAIALRVANGWLSRSPAPMGVGAGRADGVATYADEAGRPLFYAVDLAPKGFVIVAADDEVEPVLAFSNESAFLARAGTPLFDLLKRDVAQRIEAAQRKGQSAVRSVSGRLSASRAKWDELLAAGMREAGDEARALGVADVSDVCVAPMVKSRWDQVAATVPAQPPAAGMVDLFIYNFFTPPYQAGSPNNYAAGCTAVTWAQIMRFHEWPKTALGAVTCEIGIDGYRYWERLMGGDGEGGPYQWADMPLVPDATLTPNQILAIGALMHDAGVGTGVRYFYIGTYGSTDSHEVKSIFRYAEAKTCEVPAGLSEAMNALRTSLDAGLPAIQNIFTEDRTGHSIVVDGYGATAGARYHHLNLGWSGHNDAWYNFPPVDVVMSDGTPMNFTNVTSVIYNIDPQVAGEMITGRITTEEGAPVGGATVTINTVPERSVITNHRGIYAIKGLAAKGTYTVAAAADGCIIASNTATVTVGNSATETTTTPNRIVDFRATALGLTVMSAQGMSVGSSVELAAGAGAGEPLRWQRNGLVLANSASRTFTLASLQPAHAGLYGLELSRDAATVESALAIVGIESTAKVVGAGTEVLQNRYVESNGNTFDQVLLEGAAASVTADHAERQITRLSFIDLDDDIVQVEYSGPGTLTLTLDNPGAAAEPLHYNQAVKYMKGHASVVITGATQDSHLSIFSVGRANAVDQQLFKPEVAYDGWAEVAFVAISSRDGKFGGFRAANTTFFAARGVTGVYAPGVAITGPLYIGDVAAFDAARPMIRVGSAADVRITGGDLLQDNKASVTVSGLTNVVFSAGSDSHGNIVQAQRNRAVLRENGVDVTAKLVTNPATTTAER